MQAPNKARRIPGAPNLMRLVPVVTVLAMLPGNAHAHLVSTRFGELYSGMLHPLTTLVHLVPWLALGLLCGLQSRHNSRWVLLVFPLAVFIGVSSARWLPGFAALEWINHLSFVVLGALVALGLRLAPAALLGLALLLGVSHGLANGSDVFEGGAWLLYGIGVTLSAYLLITLVTAGAKVLAATSTPGEIAVRAAGSWVAAIGLMSLGFLWTTIATP